MRLVVGEQVDLSDLKDRADEHSWGRPLEEDVIPSYHSKEIWDEIWTWIELDIGGKDEVCSSHSPGNIPGNVDRIVQVELLLVSFNFTKKTLGKLTVGSLND